MKLKNLFWLGQTAGETIASFGAARLVKNPDGKIQLIGGTVDDQAAHWPERITFANASGRMHTS
jgi:hypothetical protein